MRPLLDFIAAILNITKRNLNVKLFLAFFAFFYVFLTKFI